MLWNNKITFFHTYYDKMKTLFTFFNGLYGFFVCYKYKDNSKEILHIIV